MTCVTVLGAAGGPAFAERRPAPAQRPDPTSPLVLDLPHEREDVRARFRRPGPFAVEGLLWATHGSDDGARGDVHFDVTPHVGWLAPGDQPGQPGDVVKQVSFLHASPQVSLDEFREHYRGHVDVARRHMPALWQYVQNDVQAITGPGAAAAAGVVAISELWFRTSDDYLHRYFASKEDEIEFRSHEGFLDLPKAFSIICSSFALADFAR